jgi:hypothetical protein
MKNCSTPIRVNQHTAIYMGASGELDLSEGHHSFDIRLSEQLVTEVLGMVRHSELETPAATANLRYLLTL